MPKSVILTAALVLLAATGTVFASQYGGVTAAPYLNLGIGARASGMGEAYTAVVDDVDAVYWNPGALVRVENPEISLMHNEAMAGTTYEYLGYAMPTEQIGIDMWGTIGIVAELVRVNDIPQTKENPDGSYSDQFANLGEVYGAGGTMLGLSYSWQATDLLSVGATFKMINQQIALDQGWVPAFDIGILSQTTLDGFNIALVFQNLSFNLLNNAPLPLNFKFGLAYNLPTIFTAESDNSDFFNFGLDGIFPINPANMPLGLNVGMEYGYTVSSFTTLLRVGYRFNGTNSLVSDLGGLAGLTAGAGLSKSFDSADVQLDYSYVPYGILGDMQRISMTISIGQKKTREVSPPNTVHATAKTEKVLVSWSRENYGKVKGYNVYMSYQAGGKYYKLTKTPIDKYFLFVGPLQSGVRCYFIVTSVDKNDNESRYSKELSAVPE